MPEPALTDDTVAARVSERLSELVTTQRRLSLAYPESFQQLWAAIENSVAQGKKLRPRLLADTHTLLGGTAHDAVVDAACAMELLHVAFLMHDDVIDKDQFRRGEMNVSGRFASNAALRGASPESARDWGESSSILAGNLLLTLAHSLLARLQVPDAVRVAVLDVFDDAVTASAAGEQSDVWLSLHLETASAYDVVSLIENKTSAYSFQAPLKIAALLAGAPDEVCAQLDVLGRHLGVIYQLRDDILGVFGDENVTGKSALSDLREGKETLLISFARAHASWPKVEHLLGRADLSQSGAAQLRSVIEASGSRRLVESVIADRCEHARDLIDAAEIPDGLKQRLNSTILDGNARAA